MSWRHRSGRLFVLGVSLCVSGCITAATMVPRISGRVVDTTGRPVAGAKVGVIPLEPLYRDLAFELTADQRGRFQRREQVRWGLMLPVPADAMVSEFEATALHGGRPSRAHKFGGGLGESRLFGLGRAEWVDLGDLMIEDGLQ
jgi:hypothetical protein